MFSILYVGAKKTFLKNFTAACEQQKMIPGPRRTATIPETATEYIATSFLVYCEIKLTVVMDLFYFLVNFIKLILTFNTCCNVPC
jgi:hypothetical protein